MLGRDYDNVHFGFDGLRVVENGRSVSLGIWLGKFFTRLPKATSRGANISLHCRGYSYGVVDYILRHGIRLGRDVRQDRV